MDDNTQHTQEIANLQADVLKLKTDFEALNGEYYRTNFSANQDFPKYCSFTSRLKIPHSAADPTFGVVGDIVEVGGKLKICTTASPTAAVYTIVGTQA